MDDFIILGAGIAGLTAARELLRQGQRVTLIEKGREVGGLARTFEREGFRFDLGGHRFHSNNPSVLHWLHELMGEDLLRVPRVSHIKLNGRFVTYPIAFPNAFTAFSPLKATQLAASYALAHLTERGRPDHSFEDWIVKRFGSMMYQHFFQPYTEKVWGVSGQQLAAEWAAARIGLPNMWQAIRHTLRPSMNPPATAIDQFYYPRYGFGTIPQALARDIVAHGGRILTEITPGCIQPGRNGFELLGKTPSGSLRLRARELVSTIPLDQLLGMLPQNGRFVPNHPLHYRGLICLFLAIRRPQISPDSWTYFPEPSLLFGRTHEPKNWSAAMVPDDTYTSLCVEIFASPDDSVWSWADDHIRQRVVAQLAQMGWLSAEEVCHAWVVRVRHAYPRYDLGYREHLAQVHDFLHQWPGLHLVGRTGSFRYMNSDGVIEDVFRFVGQRFPQTAVSVQPMAQQNGRWA